MNMKRRGTTGPLYVDGKLIYPETLTEAVKDRKGNKLSDIIERIEQLSVDEIEQLREYVMDAVIWDDSILDSLVGDEVIRDADTLGGKYSSNDISTMLKTIETLNATIKSMENTINQLNDKVSRLESSQEPVEGDT